MGRPPADDHRQRIDIRLPLAMLERIEQALPDSQHANRTQLIEAAIACYLDELERQPVEAAAARALKLPAREIAHIPGHYRDYDLNAGAFKTWLSEIAPQPGPEWTAKQIQNRHEVNPQSGFTDRFQNDQDMPAVATKREYLILMQRGGYSSDDRYWFDQLWRQFLMSGNAFSYTHEPRSMIERIPKSDKAFLYTQQ